MSNILRLRNVLNANNPAVVPDPAIGIISFFLDIFLSQLIVSCFILEYSLSPLPKYSFCEFIHSGIKAPGPGQKVIFVFF